MSNVLLQTFQNSVGVEFTFPQIIDEIRKTLIHKKSNGVWVDPFDTYQLLVASDSQKHKRKLHFVHVIVLYHYGKGARMWYTKQIETRTMSIQEKILKETQISIEITNALEAGGISDYIDFNDETDFAIDIDASADGKSGCILEACMGWVIGNGYTARCKPEAWCAMEVADRFSK